MAILDMKNIIPSENKRFWYCYGTEAYLVRQKANNILAAYIESNIAQSDVSIIEGPTPSIDAILVAAGTISMFGGMRLVFLPELDASAMQERDIKELVGFVSSLENAIIISYSVMRDKKSLTSKKAKLLIQAAAEYGEAIEIKTLTRKEMEQFIIEQAKQMHTNISPQVAAGLIESCGEDMLLLQQEMQKLAAGADYQTITQETVEMLATKTIDADVFAMVNAVLLKDVTQTFHSLQTLFDAGYDEIMVCASLAGSFIDMYRVKTGAEAGKSYTTVHKDMHYTGSNWRLKKSAERASKYSINMLEQAISILSKLDISLKSSAVSNRILLENAVAELIGLS